MDSNADRASEEAIEELKASRKELEFINEELTAINRELKDKVDELGHANSDMQNLMDGMAITAVFLDHELCITRFTSSAVSLFNLIATDIGRRLTDLTTPLRYPELGGDATRVLEKLVPNEREVGSPDGSWYLARLLPYRTIEDSPAGVVLAFNNITECKQAQEALERSRTELLRVLAENEKARAELQAVDVAKDRFLAVLSHELRNPLASIHSAAELVLTRAVSPADLQAAAEVVRRQAHTMKAMLDDLIDVSRLTLGRLELKRERVRLSTVVTSALEIARPLLVDTPHSIELDLGNQDVELDADPLRLVEVLSNLLSNAIKYTPRDGTIAVQARHADDQLELSVKDTGIGMEPQRIPAMFEMFAQENPGDDPTHGLGIGLALVKNIVELHGGKISARSDGLGKGSEFRVVLPRAKSVPGAHAAKRASAALQPIPVAESRGLVLIADDNADASWSMAKLLEIAGFETVRVAGGVEAVLEIGRQRPRAGVIDIGMPDLNGHEVARQVRATPWGRQMVLIAATGWGQEADKHDALQAGFDAHMTKPVNPRELSELLDTLLSSRASPK